MVMVTDILIRIHRSIKKCLTKSKVIPIINEVR